MTQAEKCNILSLRVLQTSIGSEIIKAINEKREIDISQVDDYNRLARQIRAEGYKGHPLSI